ncbi:hypothetical protein AWB80_08144 [Caballeronia pedi]|uniref:Uncharacterized protein n=1 Tax=Caballeronia pedi TaxID=1777141 RepID=A0A158E3Z6_9BURK|nr:hypothetical protein [Caballeronia pedi]SAL01524.1 hypothetical protein AWB80_08144 [Caballeronia pedi]
MQPKKIEQQIEENPGVDVHDEIYVQHASGPMVGRVVAHGAHGATVDIKGKHHQVRWKHVLGAKKRATQHFNVVDEGEDGYIVEDGNGKRRFLNVAPGAREDKLVVKAFGGNRLVLLAKARGNDAEAEAEQMISAPKFNPGDRVLFSAGDFDGSGVVVGEPGKDGAYVKDESGRVHQVRWNEMSATPDAS